MKKRILALTLALSLLLSSCGGRASAAAMHLRRTEGTVGVSDDGGKEITPRENLGLYSGYGVDTQAESYAWIDLDNVKLVKLDEDSEIAITKEDKKLEVEVKSGSLFFNVTEPLADDETMNIRTSTMLVGIRGTCGWVTQDAAALLEGTVEVTAGEQSVTISAGEMAVVTAEGKLEVKPLTAADIPDFVIEEVQDNDDLAAAILDDSGLDVTGGGASSGDLDDYADILDRIEARGEEVLYAEVLDFEADGKPELLVIKNLPTVGDYITIQIWRKGMEENALMGFSAMSYNVNGIGITSLVEYGGRLFIRIQRTQTYPSSPGAFRTETTYAGSVAQEEGSLEDWGWVDMFECSQHEFEPHYSRYLHDEHGFTTVDLEELTAGEFAAAQAQYKELKVLVYYTSDRGSIVLPDPSEIEAFPQPAEPQQPEESSGQTGEAVSELPADFVGEYTAAEEDKYFPVTFTSNGKCSGGGDKPGSGPYNHYGSSPDSITQYSDGTVVVRFTYSAYTFYPVGHGDSQYPDAVGLKYVVYDADKVTVYKTSWYYK